MRRFFILQGAGESVCTLLLKLAQRALAQSKFAFASPVMAAEDAREKEGDGDVEGGDGVEEDLENKELPEDEIDEVERPKQSKAEDAEEEYEEVSEAG